MKKILLIALLLTAVMGIYAQTEREANGIPYVQLNNGEWMPRFGIGTFTISSLSFSCRPKMQLKNLSY